MRINLVTPFAEKDAAKALGARWDSIKKLWYIVDVADLTPFMRWIPNMNAATVDSLESAAQPSTHNETSIKRSTGVVTISTTKVAHCGCTEPAWEDCVHTRNA